MNQVALMPQETSRHACWEDAIERVGVATRTGRDAMWLRDTGEGVFVFDAKPADAQKPIAWIADPVQYQTARSRGDLEDLDSFSHAGPEPFPPTRRHPNATEKS